MARVFIYARVSTSDQTTEIQVREVEMAGFTVETKRRVNEAGSVTAVQRPGVARLMHRLEATGRQRVGGVTAAQHQP